MTASDRIAIAKPLAHSAPAAISHNLIIALVALVQFVNTADFILVTVALPSIGKDLGVSTSASGWIVSVNALTYAAFLLLGGRLSDRLGQRRCTILGVAMFGACSLVSALSIGFPMLLIARALQGVANAIMAPATFAMLNTLLPHGAVRNRGFSTMAVTQGFSSLLGAGAGGVLTSAFGWRASFLMSVPLAAIAVAIAVIAVPRIRPSETKKPMDYAGAVLATAATGLIVFGLSSMHKSGWTGAIDGGGSFVAGLAMFVLFFFLEARLRHPLVPYEFLTSRKVEGPNIAIGFAIVVTTGVMLLSNLFMQRILGFSAMQSGFGVAPFSLAGAAAGWCLRRSFARFSPRANMLGGIGLYLVGLLFFATLSPTHPYLLHIAPGMVLGGFGSVMGLLACMAESTAGIPEEHQGGVSGLVYVSQKFGRAAGAAITLTILSVGTASGIDPFVTYRHGYWFLAGSLVIALASIAFISPPATEAETRIRRATA